MTLFQRRPFAMRLLNAVLAEAALARGDRLVDDRRGHRLRHRDQLDVAGLAAGRLGGERYLLAHERKPLGDGGGACGASFHDCYLTGLRERVT